MRNTNAMPLFAALIFVSQSYAFAADPENPAPTGNKAPSKARLSNEMPTKGIIEFPLKMMLKDKTGSIPPANRNDFLLNSSTNYSKINNPLSTDPLQTNTASITTSSTTPSIPKAASSKHLARNVEHVQAGLVAWSSDFATACQKSKASGKPVLLFQMMGKLDEEFC